MDLTLNVNTFPRPFQLQAWRFYARPSDEAGRYLILWEIYPGPDGLPYLIFSSDPQTKKLTIHFSDKKPGPGWESKTHPLGLYLKSHLIGKKCQEVKVVDGEVHFLFSQFGALRLHAEGASLAVHVSIPERKEFSKSILLSTASLSPHSDKTGGEEVEASPAPVSAGQKKWEKLRANVERDIQSAEAWLLAFGPILEKLRVSPASWGREADFSPEELEALRREATEQSLPTFVENTRADALEKLFSLRRRMERKKKMAAERLAQVLGEKEKVIQQNLRPQAKNQRAVTSAAKGPGICVEPEPGLLVWIGKSSQENDELFRKFRDRDLWFHARGMAGAHVWIPRGQKAFPKKSEPPEALLQLGSQIALINSKYKSAGEGEVDVAERRFLKKGHAPGEVLILKSRVRRVRLDKELEKRLFPKKLSPT